MLITSPPATLSMLKFKPATQDFYICLRCQCRLNLQHRPRFGPRRPTGYPQQLRRFTPGPNVRQDQVSSSLDSATGNGTLERIPEGAFPHKRSRYVYEPSRKDSLGLKVLGEPAEVLILPNQEKSFRVDSNITRVRASGPDKNPAQEPISSSEMLEKMNAERGLVDIDEVCENIESVRASWTTRTQGGLTEDAYKDLVSRLEEGFTKSQLGAYLNRARKDPAADVFDLNIEVANDMYARSSWQLVGDKPLQSSKAPKLVKGMRQGGSNKKDVPGIEEGQTFSKNALVKIILRQCWNITRRHQGSSLGEMDMRLRKLHLSLILNHKRDILKLISRSYDSKVEAWPQHHIIRITSDYDNCVDIFKLLVHTLENIRHSTINVAADIDSTSNQGSKLSPKKLSNVMLRQIEEYTNTLVRPHGLSCFSLNKCRVSFIGPDDADLLETQRLIHQILRPAPAENLALAWSKGDKRSNLSPVPIAVDRRLSLLDRSQQWSRWRSPQIDNLTWRENKKDESPASNLSVGPAIQVIHGKAAVDTVKAFFDAPDDISYELHGSNTPHWIPEIEYHDSVKLGQVLFPTKMTRLIADALGRIMPRQAKHKLKIDTNFVGLRSSKLPREFVPLVPGLIRSLESFGPLEKSEDLLQIRLSPSSKNASLPVPVKNLPDLEIRILLDHEKKMNSIKDVRLVNRKNKDFLQPRNVVDLRFVREQCVHANNDSIDPRIASFVQDSNFDIWGTGRLKTPLGLSLSIPALAVQAHNGFDPKEYATVPVDYTSLGLEHRSLLTMCYQESNSWPTLTYTNVEAGHIGGRRDELSLHNFRFASKQLAPANPYSSAVSVDEEVVASDDHASILLHKTACLIKTIEEAGNGGTDRNDLQMTDVKRWRLSKMNMIRRVNNPKPVRKVAKNYMRSLRHNDGVNYTRDRRQRLSSSGDDKKFNYIAGS